MLALGALAFALTGWAMQPARRAERMEREFLAAASHELKSPLAVIITSAELLPSGGEEAKYRANILSEAHRMAQLVQELLSLSRLETAARQIMPAKLDTEAFLWEVYETWQPVAAKAGDRLTLRLPDGALPPIRAEEDALKQVMAILLSNAVQHTPSGTAIRNFPPWRRGERSACRWPIRDRALRIRNGLSKSFIAQTRKPAMPAWVWA